MAWVAYSTQLPDTYVSNPNLGWNAGANSVTYLDNAASYSFQIAGTPSGIVTGISDPIANTGFGYLEIEYAFYFANGSYKIYESGVQKTGAIATAANDIYAVARIGTAVTYHVNGVLIYTSATPAVATTMVVDASLFSGGDQILNAEIIDAYEGSINIDTSSALDVAFTKTIPITVDIPTNSILAAGVRIGVTEFMGLNIPTSSALYTTMGVISEWTVNIDTSSILDSAPYIHNERSEASFELFTTFASDTPLAVGEASFEALYSYGSAGFLVPEIANSNTQFAGLITTATSLTGEIGTGDASFEVLDTLAADHAYGESNTSFYGLLAAGGEYVPFDARGFLLAPSFTLNASGLSLVGNSFSGTLPALTLKAQGGNGAIIDAPLVTLNGAMTNLPVGRVSADAPKVTLTSNVVNGVTAVFQGQWSPSLSLTSYTGGYAKLTIPKFSISSSSTTGSSASAQINAPLVTANIRVAEDQYGRAYLDVPVVTSVYGFAELEIPAFSISAHAFQVDAGTASYAMNIATNAVSQYTNYHFDSIFRFNGTYYGISNNTMFSLDGTLDNGSLISSTVELAPSDFGSSALKRMPYTYIGGRADQTITVDPQADEVSVGTYTAVAQDRTGTHTRRVRLPKGAKGRYWGIRISNTNGDSLDIDSVEYKVDILSRKL